MTLQQRLSDLAIRIGNYLRDNVSPYLVPSSGTTGHVLTKTLSGFNWVAPSSGVSDGDKGDITVSNNGGTWKIDLGISATQHHIHTAGFFINTAISGNSTTLAGVVDRFQMHPWTPSRDTSIDQIGIEVTTALANSNAKIVVYASDASGAPSGNPLIESTNLDCASVGFKPFTVNYTFLKGVVYWIGVRTSSTQTLRAYSVASARSIGQPSAASAPATALLKTLTFATSAGTWGTVTAAQFSVASVYQVIMRLA